MTWQAGRRGGAVSEGDDHGVDASTQDADAVDELGAEDVDAEPVDDPGGDDPRWGGWASDASI